MKKIKNFVSWISFLTILFSVVVGSVFSGACVANYLQDNVFHFSGWYCLINFIPCSLTAFGMCVFFILGLKRFGGE